MGKKTIKDVDLKGKRVFCRVDFNVPMRKEKLQTIQESVLHCQQFNTWWSKGL